MDKMPKFFYNGKPFNNATELARYLNFDRNSMYHLLKNKCGDVTDIVNNRIEFIRRRSERLGNYEKLFGVEFDNFGKVQFTIKEKFGIKYQNLIKNLGEDYAFKLLRLTVKDNNNLFLLNTRTSFIYGGIEFKSLKKFCNHYMLDMNSFRKKFVDTEGDISESINLADNIDRFNKKYEFVIDGRKFDSVMSLATHYNVNHATLLLRLKSGMAVEQAIKELKKLKPVERNYMPLIEIDGVTFKSKLDLMNYFGLSYKKVTQLLNESDIIKKFIKSIKEESNQKPNDFSRLMFNEETTLEEFLTYNELKSEFADKMVRLNKSKGELLDGFKSYFNNNHVTIGGVKYYTAKGLVKATGNGFHSNIFKFIDISKKPSDDESDDLVRIFNRSNKINEMYLRLGGTGEGSIYKLSKLVNLGNHELLCRLYSRNDWSLVESSILENTTLKTSADTERFYFMDDKSLDLFKPLASVSKSKRLVYSVKHAPTDYIATKLIRDALDDKDGKIKIDYVIGFKDYIRRIFSEEILAYNNKRNSLKESSLYSIDSIELDEQNSSAVEMYSKLLNHEFNSLNEVSNYLVRRSRVSFVRLRRFFNSHVDLLNVIELLSNTPFEFLIQVNENGIDVAGYTFNDLNHFTLSFNIHIGILLSELTRNNYNIEGAFYYAYTYYDFLYDGNTINHKGEKFNSVNALCNGYGVVLDNVTGHFVKNRDFYKSLRIVIGALKSKEYKSKLVSDIVSNSSPLVVQ